MKTQFKWHKGKVSKLYYFTWLQDDKEMRSEAYASGMECMRAMQAEQTEPRDWTMWPYKDISPYN